MFDIAHIYTESINKTQTVTGRIIKWLVVDSKMAWKQNKPNQKEQKKNRC